MRPYQLTLFALAILILPGCSGNRGDIRKTLDDYVAAANAHDMAIIEKLLSEDVVWHLGPDTLVGRGEVMGPLRFDEGARTRLVHSNIEVHGDTIDFDLLETNDVLLALGIPELHHFVRFVIRDGAILHKGSRRPPQEIRTFVDSVTAFSRWLHETDPESHARIWGPTGKFQYTSEVGELMAALAKEWRNQSKH